MAEVPAGSTDSSSSGGLVDVQTFTAVAGPTSTLEVDTAQASLAIGAIGDAAGKLAEALKIVKGIDWKPSTAPGDPSPPVQKSWQTYSPAVYQELLVTSQAFSELHADLDNALTAFEKTDSKGATAIKNAH
jgi:hypothetical protein